MPRVRMLLVTAVMLVASGLMYPPPGVSSDACASAEIRSGRDQALQGPGTGAGCSRSFPPPCCLLSWLSATPCGRVTRIPLNQASPIRD
jgi:hypothetical protein